MKKNSTNRSRISYKDIKLTMHSKLRAEERIGLTSSEEIRKLALSARYKGINLNALSVDNYEQLGLNKESFKILKGHFSRRTNSEKLYYYKGKVFIFCGNEARTLKTIINVNMEVA